MLPSFRIDNLDDKCLRKWSACVYVKKESYTPEHIRQQLMKSCGGQCKVYCSTHQVPLISVPKKNYCKCSCTPALPSIAESITSPPSNIKRLCSKNAVFVCPIKGCRGSICKNHHTEVKETDKKFFVANTPGCWYGNLSNQTKVQSHGDSFDWEGANNKLQLYECDEKTTEYSYPINNENVDQHLDVLESVFTKMWENTDDTEFVTDPIDNSNNFLPDDVDPHEDQMNIEISLPTTDAGVMPIYSVVDNEPYYSHRMTNHALLNCYGGCLVRRNQHLQATLKQRNFLQRLVANNPQTTMNESVPLIYPEGMLFTDQFYSSNEDGSIIGALPSALHHDDKVLQQNGFASLQDHFRSRMSNPGILASSNPLYHFSLSTTLRIWE